MTPNSELELTTDPECVFIDRITQRAYLVNMNGESYRLKQTKKINSTKA